MGVVANPTFALSNGLWVIHWTHVGAFSSLHTAAQRAKALEKNRRVFTQTNVVFAEQPPEARLNFPKISLNGKSVVLHPKGQNGMVGQAEGQFTPQLTQGSGKLYDQQQHGNNN